MNVNVYPVYLPNHRTDPGMILPALLPPRREPSARGRANLELPGRCGRELRPQPHNTLHAPLVPMPYWLH
jgi:hypothetical protein